MREQQYYEKIPLTRTLKTRGHMNSFRELLALQNMIISESQATLGHTLHMNH